MSQVFQWVLVWDQRVIHLYLRYFIHLKHICVKAHHSLLMSLQVVVLSLFFSDSLLQTYGSGNLKHVGVILQRAVLILLLACFPCWALLINTQSILLAVRQSPEVAR